VLTFDRPLDPAVAGDPRSHFAQAWNYRYSNAYGSPEYAPDHPGLRGHTNLAIASAQVLPDGRSLFLELPELQPVNQLHLHVQFEGGVYADVFATVHKLGPPFQDYPGYKPSKKTILPHPILFDLAHASQTRANPWLHPLPDARPVTIEAGKNLSFNTPTLTAHPGEPIRLTFRNPDVVPHNWVLLRPGSLQRVGDLVNRLVADPEAAARSYVPESEDVLAFTDIVEPGQSFTISFRAPSKPGRYPYLCSFPGHWMVMNGQLIVE
jgi:azurin